MIVVSLKHVWFCLGITADWALFSTHVFTFGLFLREPLLSIQIPSSHRVKLTSTPRSTFHSLLCSQKPAKFLKDHSPLQPLIHFLPTKSLLPSCQDFRLEICTCTTRFHTSCPSFHIFYCLVWIGVRACADERMHSPRRVREEKWKRVFAFRLSPFMY